MLQHFKEREYFKIFAPHPDNIIPYYIFYKFKNVLK